LCLEGENDAIEKMCKGGENVAIETEKTYEWLCKDGENKAF